MGVHLPITLIEEETAYPRTSFAYAIISLSFPFLFLPLLMFVFVACSDGVLLFNAMRAIVRPPSRCFSVCVCVCFYRYRATRTSLQCDIDYL